MARERLVFVRSVIVALVVGLLPALAAAQEVHQDPADPVLHGDPLDPASGRVAEIPAGTPWIRPGPDGSFGGADDLVSTTVVGDVDLVIRTGLTSIAGSIPDPAPLRGAIPGGVIEPFGAGMPIFFVVVPSDGGAPAPYGSPAAPPYFEGLPVFVVAFADLDGDGFIGVTHLDGDSTDASIEQAELAPVGRRYALGVDGAASGALFVTAGGPPGNPLRIALTAGAYAGPFRPDYFEGIVPDGPAVSTRLPFLPLMDPGAALVPFPLPFAPAEPEGRVGMRALPAFIADPSDPRIGEVFTLRLDGSQPSIDVAHATSGAPAQFGLAERPDPTRYLPLPTRPLRPGLDTAGNVIPLEILNQLIVPDDGAGNPTVLRIVALDQLGNVTAPATATSVEVRTRNSVRIVSPDTDADPFRETVLVQDARGVEIALDDWGGAFDDRNHDRLTLKAQGRPLRIDVALPDPDLDDDGQVTLLDHQAIQAHLGAELGEASYDAQLDLSRNGRIDAADLERVVSALGESVPADTRRRRGKKKVKGGDCEGKLVEAVFRYMGEGCGASQHLQEDDACTGGAAFAEPVRVLATAKDVQWTDASELPLGGTAVVSAAIAGEKSLAKKTSFEIHDAETSALLESFELDTHCKHPLFVGDQIGSLRLIALTSTKGGTVVLREPRGQSCSGHLLHLDLRYVGGDCQSTTNLQEGKLKCEGGDPGPGPVSVVVAKEPDKIGLSPGGPLALGDVIHLAKHDGKDLPGDMKLEISGAGATQSLEIHTSCSKPLAVGDRFGAFLLLGFESE
jgi:hypothetical protein